MQIAKHLIETGLQCYSKNLGFKVGLKLKFKSEWIAMCSLVMSLSSREFLIKYYLPWQLIYSSYIRMQYLVFRW